MIQPLLDYGSPIWSAAAPTTLQTLTDTHKRYLKFILNIPAFQHGHQYEDLVRTADLQTVSNRALYLSLSIAYNQTVLGPYDQATNIPTKTPHRCLRNQDIYVIPSVRLTRSQRGFTTRIPKFLNLHKINIAEDFIIKRTFLWHIKDILHLHP